MSLLNEAKMPSLKDKIAAEAEKVREELEKKDQEDEKVIKKVTSKVTK